MSSAPPTGPSITDWMTAFGTVGATVVALALAGRDQVRGFFFHPRLDVSIRRGPPDCHIIQEESTVSFGEGRDMIVSDAVFYSRLAINNKGNRRARQVEVRMTKLWRRDEASAYVEDEDFLPMNLTWAHLEKGLAVPVLDPDLPRHCNLCHFYEPGDKPLMRFNTEVQPLEVGPDRWPTMKPPGIYRAEIAVTADNAEPIRRKVDIEFTGEWFQDAVQIAEKSLKITVSK